MKTLLVLLIACTGVVAQSKDDLKKKYVQPVAETYVIRSGIIVTVSYDSAGKITEMLIAPELTGLIKSKTRALPHEDVEALIDELIPVAARGSGRFAGAMNIECMEIQY